MRKFHVVSMGPGSEHYILPAAIDAVRRADLLFGSESLIRRHAGEASADRLVPLSGSVEAFMQRLDEERRSKDCAVLVTGDAGFFSLLAAVRNRFSPDDYDVVPGITAFQLACAKLGLPWQDFRLASAHGRSLDSLSGQLSPEYGAVVLTDRKNTPAAICRYLSAHGWSDRRGWICENIALPEESIYEIKLGAVPEKEEYHLCLLILQPGSME